MKIGFIVEGLEDVDFIELCLKSELEQRGYEIGQIVPLGGSKIFLHSAKHVNQQINFFSVDKVFILVDKHSYPCITYVMEKFGDLKNRPEVKIIVVIKEITAWFLSDFDAIEWINRSCLKTLKQSAIGGNTETISDPKGVFIQSKGNKIKTRRAFKIKIGQKFDIVKARRRSPSFDRLLNALDL